MIAGLVGAGMSGTAAVPAVFLFRLATFWLPILPGWIASTTSAERTSSKAGSDGANGERDPSS